MKKIVLIAATVAFSISMAKAQEVNPGSVQQIDTLRNIGSARVDTTALVKVKQTAIPASLRTTLKDREYSGWEKGTLYQNPKSKEYILQLKPDKAGTSKKPNWFKFDSKGKRIPDVDTKIN